MDEDRKMDDGGRRSSSRDKGPAEMGLASRGGGVAPGVGQDPFIIIVDPDKVASC